MKKIYELTKVMDLSFPYLSCDRKPFLCLEEAERFFPVVELENNFVLTISDKRFTGARSVMVKEQSEKWDKPVEWYDNDKNMKCYRTLYCPLEREIKLFLNEGGDEKKLYFKIEAAPENNFSNGC